jgi:hypothetical protein
MISLNLPFTRETRGLWRIRHSMQSCSGMAASDAGMSDRPNKAGLFKLERSTSLWTSESWLAGTNGGLASSG